MSDILKMAFEKASEVKSESEQEVFARWLLDALDQDEKRWEKAFRVKPSWALVADADKIINPDL